MQFTNIAHKIIILIISQLLLMIGFLLSFNHVSAFYASGPIELEGNAWSSTIGWISLNCLTGGPSRNNVCGTSNYKVTIQTNGSLTGYAWSNNIGWVRFGGLSNFPTGSGTTAQNVQLVDVGGGNYELRGWARACTGAANVSTCSGGANPSAGGWDGWIALSGTNHRVRFAQIGPVTNSYAWGSTVVGWVDFFSRVSFDASVPPTIGNFNWQPPAGPLVAAAAPTVAFVNFNAVVAGCCGTYPVTVSVDGNPNTFSGTISLLTGSGVFTPQMRVNQVLAGVPQTARLTINADPPVSANRTFTIPYAAPTIVVNVQQSLLRKGETTRVSVTVNSLYELSCSITGAGISETFVTTFGGGDYNSPEYITQPVNSFNRMNVVCTDLAGGTHTATNNVQVVPTFQET